MYPFGSCESCFPEDFLCPKCCNVGYSSRFDRRTMIGMEMQDLSEIR